MAEVCPTCGRPAELPRITPERLFFLCGAAVRRFGVLPDGCGGEAFAVAADGVIYQMTPGEFDHYQRLCAHAEDFNTAAA